VTTYAVLLPGDEAQWESTTPVERERVYGVHRAFAEALAARGHRVTGGAELTHSREAKVLRTSAAGEQTVTDGPYAESVEQLTGFYLVESDDLDDLIDVCRILGRGEGAVEVRATTGGAG
jgi:hypothetical protein